MKDITETLLQSKACKPSIHPLGTSTAAATPAHFDFTKSLLTADNLAVMPLPQRRRLLGAWLCEGDLGYLFAPRGHGKSWMAMLIANAVATGASLGSWQKGEEARPVFYFDAEMNLPDVQNRAQKIGITSESFHWLSNEHLYMDQAISVNIASTEHQSALSAMLPDGALFIIDNLSTSQSGMKENDNDDFDKIKDWLLSLRRRSITVLIVHHAGRSGEMRGSSRREDPAHWILSLRDASEDGAKAKQFITTFTKCRNCQGRDAMPLRWTLQDEADRITVFCESFSGSDALLAHIRDGIVSATDLAQTLNVQTSTISKWAKKLMQAGLIRKNGRDYEPVDWPI